MPPSFDPLTIVHGLRSPCQIDANTTFGFPGISSRSAGPLLSETYSTFFHDFPPSFVRKTPRSVLEANGFPSAATYAMFGLDGCTRNVEICPTSRSPVKLQVFPASTDL